MGTELVWPSLCLAVGLLLLVAEVFVPSGGLIGVLAVGFLGVSLYLAFSTTSYGLIFLLVAVVMMPLMLMLAVYLWPRTPMAKYLFLSPPTREDVEPDSQDLLLERLVGQFGRTLTPLRPSGRVDFEGHRFEGVSEEGLIPAGVLVRAVQVRSGRLVVREADVPALDDVVS
jgi:membrane-bound ClpP family serine protease